MATLVPILNNELSGGPALSWQQLQQAYGLTVEEARAMQLKPPAGVDDIDATITPPPAGHPDAEVPP